MLAAAPARAQLTVEIIGGGGTTIPIAIVPFENEATWPLGVSGIVAADLQRSGLFRQVSDAGIVPRPTRAEDVRLGDFRARGADAVVVGSMRPLADGRVDVRFALLDAVKQVQLASMSYVVTPAQFRATGHKIADVIYEKLTGDAGVFSTRIAYITKQGNRFELIVADADGGNPQAIVGSNEPLLSPAWSPDGSRIAYVSLENKKPVVYVQSMATGDAAGHREFPRQQQRARVGAGRPPPCGDAHQGWRLAALPHQCRRLRRAAPIQLRPASTPSPRSRRTGARSCSRRTAAAAPQIYRLYARVGAVERMTFDGGHNVSPRATPDGKGFVFVRRDGGRYQVAILDFATRQIAGADAGPARRMPEHRAESQAHHLRERERWAWYIWTRCPPTAASSSGSSRRRPTCVNLRGGRCPGSAPLPDHRALRPSFTQGGTS